MADTKSATRQAGIREIRNVAGARSIAASSDFGDDFADFESSDADVLLEDLGVMIVRTDPETEGRVRASASAQRGAIEAVEPELFMFAWSMGWPIWPFSTAPGTPAPSPGPGTVDPYLRGYRDAVMSISSGAGAAGSGFAGPAGASAGDCFDDTAGSTWGLKATGTPNTSPTGAGIRVAVLDTGMDLGHPDFAGRAVSSRSFVPGETAQDGNGHGTHCIGTSCGPSRSGNVPAYGIASDAQIFAGKVLSDRGSGPDRGILAGIEWAIRNECRVISMSLGAPAPPSRVYEAVARRAIARGSLIVAASGNDSRRRQGRVAPVSRPANAESILAVAAVDRCSTVADFSNASSGSRGGQIDLAGPGVGVWSAFPVNRGSHRSLSGTSMATPHVAGVAALYAELLGDGDANRLWRALAATGRRLGGSSIDVGGGMVQAP